MRVVAVALVALATATAAASSRSIVSLTVSPATVHRGGMVTIRGYAGGCPVGDVVTIISHAFPVTHEFAGVPAVFAKVRSHGAFHTTTAIPSHRKVKRYTVTARCGGGNLGVLAHLRVT
jgi:hypothetical protein